MSVFDGRAQTEPLALVMVGLPARGKTHIARRLDRYLRWLGVATRVFNVGNYRREHLGSQQPHEFFNPDNAEGRAAREKMAVAALDDMIHWFGDGGEVGIYDATNTTRARRSFLATRLSAHRLRVIFVESVCEDEALIAANIQNTKRHMPDYADVRPEDAVADFRARIAHYARAYEPVAEEEGSFVRVIDVGTKLVAHRIQGALASRLVSFLMNLHLEPRSIFLTRHGESTFNVEDRIGGDPGPERGGDGLRGLARVVRSVARAAPARAAGLDLDPATRA